MRTLCKCLTVAFPFVCSIASADVADVLEEYKGYTIADVKTVDGYIDNDGKRSDSFEGCEFERKIVFTDGTALTCSTYHYHYAYRPRP